MRAKNWFDLMRALYLILSVFVLHVVFHECIDNLKHLLLFSLLNSDITLLTIYVLG